MEQIYNTIKDNIETLNDDNVDMVVLSIMTYVKDDYNIVEDYEIYMLTSIVDFVVRNIKDKYKTISRLKLQMNKLQALELPEQRSKEWYDLRRGMLTASSLACALGEDHFKSRDELILEKAEDEGKTICSNPITDWM